MNIYEKEYKENDEIFNEVKRLVENNNLGSKLAIVRMFSAAQREYEDIKLKERFEERIGRKYIQDVVILDEKSAIVSYKVLSDSDGKCFYQPVILNNYQNIAYETFEQALIGMVCLKTGNVDAWCWICKMLGME